MFDQIKSDLSANNNPMPSSHRSASRDSGRRSTHRSTSRDSERHSSHSRRSPPAHRATSNPPRRHWSRDEDHYHKFESRGRHQSPKHDRSRSELGLRSDSDSGYSSGHSDYLGDFGSSGLSGPSRPSRHRRPFEDPPPSGRLCGRCQQLDLNGLVSRRWLDPIELKCWMDLDQSCPFCRLVIDCVMQNDCHLESGNIISVMNELSWPTTVSYSLYEADTIEEGEKKFSTYYDLRDLREKTKREGFGDVYKIVVNYRRGDKAGHVRVGNIQKIQRGGQGNMVPFYGRKVEEIADLNLARQWLERCDEIHGDNCQNWPWYGPDKLDKIRLINIRSKKIIRADQRYSYAALSYVWGDQEQWSPPDDKQNDNEIALPDILELSRTVGDAISVTRALGLQYLWVDSLCALPHDREPGYDKTSQIKHMDSIYNFAKLTIVAAAGLSSKAGLAGISRKRMITQRIEEIGGSMFGIPFPQYHSLHGNPALYWNSRGWTFQEKLLSKKMLVFTDFQMYWHCPHMVWCEDTVLESCIISSDTETEPWPLSWIGSRQLISVPDVDSVDSLDSGIEQSVQFSKYRRIIYDYTKRTLTEKTDAIKAIYGILCTLNPVMGRFVAGLPEVLLGSALLWQPCIKSSTKPFPLKYPKDSERSGVETIETQFPTWSWARWDLPRGCEWTSWISASCASLISPGFLLKGSSGGDYEVLDLPFFSNGCSECPSLDINPLVQQRLDMIKHMILIKARHANLFVQQLDTSVYGEYLQNTVNEYKLTDDRGNCVGMVRMQYDQRAQWKPSPIKAIAISTSMGYESYGSSIAAPIAPKYIPIRHARGQTSLLPPECLDPREYPVHNIMLISKAGEIGKPGSRNIHRNISIGAVVERVAIGVVVSSAWERISEEEAWFVLA
jgi:heterokaryon incompatibility protein (HET)